MSGKGQGTLTASALIEPEPSEPGLGSPHLGGPKQGSPQQGSPQQGSPKQGSPKQGSSPERTKAGRAGPEGESAFARRLRARGLVCGQTPAQVASVIKDECGAKFGTTWIRAYRLALGITLADVVEQIRAWYEAQGREQPRFSETLLSAYESGQKRPGPEYLHYLCAVYGADPQDLGYQGTCFCGSGHRSGLALTVPDGAAVKDGPAHERRDGHPAWTAGGRQAGPGKGAGQARAPGEGGAPRDHEQACLASRADDPMPVGADDDDVLRRALLRLIAGVSVSLDSQFFGAVDRVRRRMDDALFHSSVSASMLDQWEETVAGYGRQYMTVPPMRLLCDVLLDFGDVRRMCEQRQPIEFAERLCRLAAQLAALTGMTMIDIGDQRTARSFFRTARIAADETGDRSLRAWVAVREALIPLYYGDPREAVELARAGADLAGRGQCVASVMAPMAEARALGRLAALGKRGVLARARASLDRAAEGLESLPDSQRADTAFGYTERQYFFHRGDALIELGDHGGAEEAFGQSLRMYSPAEFLDRSLVMLGQAQCRLAADEPEEALRISRDTVLDLPSEHRTKIIVHAARALGDSVAARHGGLLAVDAYRSELLSALSTGALWPGVLRAGA
jgi:transcriptional regulator with XRE-family HTH domain/tetratricopeptide (TPR) repeat protein